MFCACTSTNKEEFTAEMMIHFSGLKHLADSGVLVFPKLLVCLDCGFSRFTIPEQELALLAGDTPTIEASHRRGVLTKTQFVAEINVHFPGLRNLDKPPVLVFPKLLVCLGCGVSKFTLPEGELGLLRGNIAA